MNPVLLKSLQRFRWASVFLLGLIAYSPTLAVRFVGDDFSHMLVFHQALPGLSAFTTVPGLFYRPVGMVVTWNLGYNLFGTNALPYHIVSLLLHATVSLLLARVVAKISNEPRIGWIAGALFAVYPLCTEPIAWLASQWDLFAAVCALSAVLGFVTYWKTRDWRAYALALLAATVGVFTKESVLPLPLVLPFVALVTEFGAQAGKIVTPENRRAWFVLLRRALLVSAPFLLPSLLFVALRLVYNGSIGGYDGARTDYLHFFWDTLVATGSGMVTPFNRRVFDGRFVQIAGMLTSSAFLLGLFLWGRPRWHLHLLAAAWWLIFLAPVINIISVTQPTYGNRLLYFSLMGFCISVAAIVSVAIDQVRVRWFVPALAALLAVVVPITWMQLQPWLQASNQADRILVELDRVLVPVAGHRLQLNIKDLPTDYRGAYVFQNGLNEGLNLFDHRLTISTNVSDLNASDLADEFNGVAGIYNFDFGLDSKQQLYHVTYASGATIATEPPAADHVWNYTTCSTSDNLAWQPKSADFSCTTNGTSPPLSATSYASFTPITTTATLQSPDMSLDLTGSTWVRLGVLEHMRSTEKGQSAIWSWAAPAGADSPDRATSDFELAADQSWRVYWTYVPVSRIGTQLKDLSFSPVSGTVPIDIGWISVQLVP